MTGDKQSMAITLCRRSLDFFEDFIRDTRVIWNVNSIVYKDNGLQSDFFKKLNLASSKRYILII